MAVAPQPEAGVGFAPTPRFEIIIRFEIPPPLLELIAAFLGAARQSSPLHARPAGHAAPPAPPQPAPEPPSSVPPPAKRRRGRPRKDEARPKGPAVPPDHERPVTCDDLLAAFDFLLHQPDGELRIMQVFSQFRIGTILGAKPSQYTELFNALRIAASS